MQKHTLPELPYEYNALEPYISEEIMKLHHGKHHAAYVNNLNAALEKHPELFEKTVEELLADIDALPVDIRMAVRNNGGGHANHSLFWQLMRPGSWSSETNGTVEPEGKIADAIKKQFGSFEDFQQQFNDEGVKRFGSGWVWLVKNKEGQLQIISTANQDIPLSQGLTPILGNDVWEHAYYLQYKNVRADYLKAWWNLVNWPEVEERFTAK